MHIEGENYNFLMYTLSWTTMHCHPYMHCTTVQCNTYMYITYIPCPIATHIHMYVHVHVHILYTCVHVHVHVHVPAGKSSMKQFMPMKPVKRGFKVWVRANTITGYFWDLDVIDQWKENGDWKHTAHFMLEVPKQQNSVYTCTCAWIPQIWICTYFITL